MKQKFYTVRLKKFASYILVLLLLLLLLLRSKEAMNAARQALILCYNTVIPSLFPFFIISGLLTAGGFVTLLSKVFSPVMKPVFNMNGSGALPFLIGIISGYPMGAKITSELFSDGALSRSEAQRLLPFSNNSGPLFIIGAVGTGMLQNIRLGIFLYAVHVVCAVLVGICFRWYKAEITGHKPQSPRQSSTQKTTSFSAVVATGTDTMLLVCGFIVFFAALSACLTPLLDTLLPIPLAKAVKALLEVTNGADLITKSGLSTRLMLAWLSAAIGFGGVCVMLQVAGIAGAASLSMKSYVLGKILHSLFSGVMTFCCFPLITEQTPTLILSPPPVNLPILPLVYGITIFGILFVCLKRYISKKAG
ncbi:MAG: hypothetical protein IJF61_01070 [Clostridia bacterium]|nr:hypothetical protein [Clostridia bacterium]